MNQEAPEQRGASEPAPHNERPILVAPDTNIHTSNYLLQTAAGSALLDIVSRANGRILLPEVVELEIKKVLLARLAEDGDKALDRLRGVEAIIQREVLKVPDLSELKAAIDQRLIELNPLVQREPFTFEIAQAALMRVIEGRPPSGSNNEQYRDCCIWEHCLRLGERYDVHLVTADGNFYKDRKPENGLAEQLRAELAGVNASVFAYPTLTKLIEHLGPSARPDDAEALGRRIAEAARDTLASHADHAGFILGPLMRSRVSVTRARVLATFELTYSLIEKSDQDEQVRLNPELSASGSCALSGPERSVRDLRLDESTVRWTNPLGEVVTQPRRYLFAHGFFAGTGSLGVG